MNKNIYGFIFYLAYFSLFESNGNIMSNNWCIYPEFLFCKRMGSRNLSLVVANEEYYCDSIKY